jgi:hypothetical protein
MDVVWHELDEAVLRRKQQNEQALREFHAEKFADEMGMKLDEMFLAQCILEDLGPHQDKMLQLVLRWDEPMMSLLGKLAKALSYRPVSIRALIIEVPEKSSHSLYWEMRFEQMYYRAWISIELQLDRQIHPIQFIVACKQLEAIYSEVTVPGIKAALLEAFHAGPMRDMNREEREGLSLEVFLRLVEC